MTNHPFVTFRLADSVPRELLDDWLRARDAFLAAHPPPWDDITEACYHGPFAPTNSTNTSTPRTAPAPCVIHASLRVRF